MVEEPFGAREQVVLEDFVTVDNAAAIEGGEGSVRPGEGGDEAWLTATAGVGPCCARSKSETSR